jgi:hypothetical protein
LVNLTNKAAQLHELFQIGRLPEIFGGAEFHHALAIGFRFGGGHDDDRNMSQTGTLPDSLENLVASPPRHVYIEQQEIGTQRGRVRIDLVEDLDRPLAVVGNFHVNLEALPAKGFLHQVHVGRAILHEEKREPSGMRTFRQAFTYQKFTPDSTHGNSGVT